MTVYIFGDDSATLYIDGVEIISTSYPDVASKNVSGDFSLLAVRISNVVYDSGTMVSLAYGSCITDTILWRCTNISYSNWNQANYSDSSWPLAVSGQQNKDIFVGSRPQFPLSCPIITYIDRYQQGSIYCRRKLN